MVTKFNEFVAEAENKNPYKLVILSHDDPEDPNITGQRLEEEAKKMKIPCYMMELEGGYITTKNSKKVVHNKDDETGFEIDPENTLVMVRGSVASRHSWSDMVTQLERVEACCVNSRHCIDVCHDKYRTSLFLAEEGLRQPKSVLVAGKDSSLEAFKQLGSDFPIILKTVTGTKGVGVLFIESERALISTVQILYKLDTNIGIMLQEYIPTKFDVRAIVLGGEVIATMQRPVIEGDFRSNVAQGSKPKTIKLTDTEISDCIKAAETVDGLWVGVDFIPAKDRNKEQPFMIEVNGSPGSSGIEEATGRNLIKEILTYYIDRSKWLRPKPFRSIYS